MREDGCSMKEAAAADKNYGRKLKKEWEPGVLPIPVVADGKKHFANTESANEQCGESIKCGEELSSSHRSSAQARWEYRAMWVSYLEWQQFDFSSAEDFRAGAEEMMANCKDLGLNTVITQVRPFADALYPSQYFPWSHLCTGTQGQDPGFDPLAILIETAHAHGLELEAWLNPYRVQLNASLPGQLVENNPALTSPELVKQAGEGLYFDPSSEEVRQLIVDGVTEIVTNYDVDGIHFDDYFYPTTESSFDETEYAVSGSPLSLEDWRRDNVNQLVKAVYDSIKAVKPEVRFGISPQGNMSENYNGQYSDAPLWLSTPGYVDYILPQLYWGYGYTTSSGQTQFGFENITKEWAALERAEGVSLYFGLGAYRIGDGDGGNYDNAVTQWQSGRNLADMIATGREVGADGYVLYRYDFLFHNGSWADLAASECQTILAKNQMFQERARSRQKDSLQSVFNKNK